MKKCCVCNEEIHPKRVEILPNTQTCVKHSTVEKKVAVTVQMGTGDHTWTETFAVEREEYDRLEEMKGNFRKSTTPESKSELSFTDDDETMEWDVTLLDGLDENDHPDISEKIAKESLDLDDIIE